MSREKENFLDRWSRLKQEQDREPAPAPAEKKEAPMPALPPLEDLKPDSDFTPFMDPRVDLETRRAALKKLFSDPHFNVPDAFEAYSEDYTKGEPIPLEMLKTLNQARRLLFDEKEQVMEQVKEKAAEQPLPEARDAAGKQDA